MARQQTWGINPATGKPMLINLGTGVAHTPIRRGLLGSQQAPSSPGPAPVAPTPTSGSQGPSTVAPAATTAPSDGVPLNQWGSTGTPPAQQGILGRTLTPAYQTQQTTLDGQTVGGFGDARGSYYGGTDAQGNEMFFATPEEAAASLEQMDALNGTTMGALSRRVLDYANQHGIRPDPDKWSKQLGGRSRADIAVSSTVDALSGLPFGITSALVNPAVVPADAEGNLLGQEFNMGGAGLAGLGGTLSYRNLNRIAAAEAAGEEGNRVFSGGHFTHWWWNSHCCFPGDRWNRTSCVRKH